MNLRRCVGSSVAVILLVASWSGTGAGVAPEPLPQDPAAVAGRAHAEPAPSAFQGAGSCSATACHGSTAPAARDQYPSRVLRNEHTTWITQDRHRQAYRVLTYQRSEEMVARLARGQAHPAAYADQRCLACHATGGLAPTSAGIDDVRQDGVSCESCHGAAGLWIGTHTQYGWHDLPPQRKAEFGMRPTKELAQRAAVCVECHIGGPGRDMNHDLIAAGHPRLNFEFAAFLANMPPHWVEAGGVGGNFPARAWAVGQAVTAKAAADLLAQRASATAEAPWPELSEYNCVACHHELANETWRQKPPPGGRRPGTPAWGSWYYPSADYLAHQGGNANLGDLQQRFGDLRSQMNQLGGDRRAAADAAQQLSRALAKWLQTLPADAASYDAAKVNALIKSYRVENAPGLADGWDGAAQRYLALQPLRLAIKGLPPFSSPASLDDQLTKLFDSLQFPAGYDSPRHYDPTRPLGNR